MSTIGFPIRHFAQNTISHDDHEKAENSVCLPLVSYKYYPYELRKPIVGIGKRTGSILINEKGLIGYF